MFFRNIGGLSNTRRFIRTLRRHMLINPRHVAMFVQSFALKTTGLFLLCSRSGRYVNNTFRATLHQYCFLLAPTS
jgi:hypothetical protein